MKKVEKIGLCSFKSQFLFVLFQALQNKHDALLERVDELDQECQELRDNLADMEDGREDVGDELKSAQEEIKELKESLQREKVKSLKNLKSLSLKLENLRVIVKGVSA